jgi:hypothetical protein
MVVTVKWGVGLRWRILIEHLLVGFNHLFNVTLRGDAKVVAIVSMESHTKMVINWSSTFQFEPILFSKRICNCLGVLTRDAEVIYVDSNVHQGREFIANGALENGAFCTVFSENFHKF